MSIKSTFSIKDLENFSGIKAHTIRIWEKRYEILNPDRSETNIRSYQLKELTKLLNISVLLENGRKISRVAEMSEQEIVEVVREISIKKQDSTAAIQSFKLAMLNFDQSLFETTYNQLLTQFSFRDIFYKIFIQLLDEIGVLWLTDTITPAHEHFISVLIQQKLLNNIERVQNNKTKYSKVFVLYLPSNEIHELGLLYLHFELLLKGHHSIYLGQSIPTDSLVNVFNNYDDIQYISYFTVEPQPKEIDTYLQDFDSQILSVRNEKLHVLGRNTKYIDQKKISPSIQIYSSIKDLIEIV